MSMITRRPFVIQEKAPTFTILSRDNVWFIVGLNAIGTYGDYRYLRADADVEGVHLKSPAPSLYGEEVEVSEFHEMQIAYELCAYGWRPIRDA